MFKCLCGGGTNANTKNTNHKATDNAPSINNMNISNGASSNKTIVNHTKNALHPSVNGDAGAMTIIQSTSNNTTPSPNNAHHHINGITKPSKTNVNETIIDNDETTGASKSPSKEHRKRKPKHVRKRTHPYKSRGDPHRTSLSATTSPQSISPKTVETGSISDYFVYDTFEFSIETFDFNVHYKFLIELAIKCLNMGPDVLSPSIFYKHNDIVCCVAILNENNHKKVPTSYNKELMNNVIGFSICYPHSNCRPYPDTVWMIGWLCADNHRVQSYNAQYLVIEALIRSSYYLINRKATSLLPKITSNLKRHLRENRQINIYLTSNEEDDMKEMEQKMHKQKKKARDKGMGIYAPYHHKKAQQLYESLGFEKIAKIGNYYSTDKELFDDLYKNEDHNDTEAIMLAKNSKKKKSSNDAYLYCRGDLAHCRLLLGMEYFNYKKWPKPPGYKEVMDSTKGAADDEKQKHKNSKESAETDIKEKNKGKEKEKEKKKRNYGPKILEEYLQRRIADYHAKQNEKLLRSKQQQKIYNANKLSQKTLNTNTNTTNNVQQQQQQHSVATVHANNASTNQSSIQKKNINTKHTPNTDIRSSANPQPQPQPQPQPHHTSIRTAHRSSNGPQQHPYNTSHGYQGHRSSGGMLYDKRIRYKQPVHANTQKYYDEYNEAQAQVGNNMPVANGTLSPNINIHHNNPSVVSDGSTANTHNSAIAKGSRHSSAANSQHNHYHATHNSGHYYHQAHGSYHHQRPNFAQVSNPGSSGQRSSVTPTPTFDLQSHQSHSQVMYYPPHLSNVSTAHSQATYTHSMAEDHGVPRGNSFYSMASSNHSLHHSGAHSINSNASLHSDHPYHPQNAYHRHSSHHSGHQGQGGHHPQHYISHGSHHSGHHHDPYGNHQRHISHHKPHDSYHDDPYNNMHQHSGHKVRNKRYTRSSRHSSHKKLPQ